MGHVPREGFVGSWREGDNSISDGPHDKDEVMCCFLTSILFAGPRFGILVWNIISPVYVNGACDHFFWGFLGWLFLPWTMLMYIGIYPGGILGFDWILLGLSVFADMTTYFGGYFERDWLPFGYQIP